MDVLIFVGRICRSGEGLIIWIPKELHDTAKNLLDKDLLIVATPVFITKKRKKRKD